jgi:hypothetical protein
MAIHNHHDFHAFSALRSSDFQPATLGHNEGRTLDPVALLAEILPPHEHERIWAIQKALDFPRYVFGVERPAAGESIMPQVMPRYAKALQSHREDQVISE